MTNNAAKRLVAAALALLMLVACAVALAEAVPTITVTSAPKLQRAGVSKKQATKPVKGTVQLGGLKASDHAIIAFIDEGAWIKPYYKKFLTKVKANGSFSVKITTGGHDRRIDEFRLFLVKKSDFKLKDGYPDFDEVLEACVADSGSLRKSDFY